MAPAAIKIVRRKLESLRPHPEQAKLFPPLSEAELQALAEDLKQNGLRHAVDILPNGTIVAGHQRVAAARMLGWTEIRCRVRYDLAEQGPKGVEEFLISDNLVRRQLTELEVAALCRRLHKLRHGKRTPNGEGDWRDAVGKRFGVSGRTISRWEKVFDAHPTIQEAVRQRRLTIGQALKLVELPTEAQRRIASGLANGEKLKDLIPARAATSADKPPAMSPAQLLRQLKQITDRLSQATLTMDVDAADLKTLKQVRRALRDLYIRLEDHDDQMTELAADAKFQTQK